MIPYIHVPDIPIGGSSPVYLLGVKVLPFALHPFGLLVATGVLTGSALILRRARRFGYDTELINSFITWVLLSGFVLSHMIDEVFYHPKEILHRPWSLLLVWEGLSSFGGFIGAIVGAVLWKYFEWRDTGRGVSFFRRRPVPIKILPVCDLSIAMFPVGWLFGRAGCSVVHDHPGMRVTGDNLLAVAYPLPGEHARSVAYGPVELVWGSGYKLDLGLLELMFTAVLILLISLTWHKRLRIGTYITVIFLAYAPVRFVMDFYRERDSVNADLRYGELTFAQWSAVAMLLFGIFMFFLSRRLAPRRAELEEALMARARPEPADPSTTASPGDAVG